MGVLLTAGLVLKRLASALGVVGLEVTKSLSIEFLGVLEVMACLPSALVQGASNALLDLVGGRLGALWSGLLLDLWGTVSIHGKVLNARAAYCR